MACGLTGYTGSKFCSKESFFGDPIGIIPVADAVEFTATSFLLKTTWDDYINAGQAFPIMDLKAFIDESTDAVYKDFENEDQRFIRQGKYRFKAEFDKNQVQKQALQNLSGFSQKVFIVYANGIRGRSLDSGVTIQGIPLSQFIVEKERFAATGEPAMIPIKVNLDDYKDLNDYDYSMAISWVKTLIGITEVDLAQVGTAIVTLVTLSVYGTAYGDDYPITGLVIADFSITGTGALVSLTDNSDGTYAIVTTTLTTNDTITLVAPASIADKELHVVSSGAATITVSA